MMARDWLIELLKDCSLYWRTAEKCADEIIAAAPDAPDSVRLELAALLNLEAIQGPPSEDK